MQTKKKLAACLLLPAFIIYACSSSDTTQATKDANNNIKEQRQLEGKEQIAHGQHLITVGGCNDCHSPKVFGPQGMRLDSSKLMSGHPAGSQLPLPAKTSLQPGQWVQMAPDVTAFCGPWGITYAANLTPDSATGIGAWTEENFIKIFRTGKHLGMEGSRPILPPMPWYNWAGQSDEDLKAVFAYLKSLPPVSNKVPAPRSPNEVITQ